MLAINILFTENMTYSAHDEIGEITASTLQLKNRLESTIKQAQAVYKWRLYLGLTH